MKKALYILLQCTWGGIATLIGLGFFLAHRNCEHQWYRCCIDTKWNGVGGLSLGLFTFTPQLAGVVIVFCNQQLHENFLGCIFLDPALRGKGLGKQVWDKVEAMYPDVKTWRTETPLCSRRNLNFYINKLGFMAYRIDEPINYEAANVQFVKYR